MHMPFSPSVSFHIPIPPGFVVVATGVAHPHTGHELIGDLLRNKYTGVYVLWDGLSARSVPQRWAARFARQ